MSNKVRLNRDLNVQNIAGYCVSFRGEGALLHEAPQ